MDYLYLFIAILSEVIATSYLKASEGFSKLYPAIVVVIGYTLSFILLSLVLQTIPMGIAYSCWAGLGIVFITAVGYVFYDQKLDSLAVIGIALIIIGVVLINIFSNTIEH
ncbi:multidrug efflux SMR transporter [Candidatus Blochmanniella camponoti]|uniref:Multidrug efflux SMR transporter n=1 Tax=Candidatus Blochmanniella camponoti TaxID=108080 RepID=A0AAE9I6M7_9ENTR|nr:multidrug efflux SMR transporter [Candidatus Blochmannia herculeanus]URJ24381.1 multidrug efflux SMR transporter [Candidatus Blochmannia herculeanus]URJ27009.1 multidrug efflux SMR transporter [Candidatus Blochmannia herculeanus]URJ27735.1 multidrug efflux SMR transporter [Candidatus Blochmannia herculeanus]